MLFKEGLNLLF